MPEKTAYEELEQKLKEAVRLQALPPEVKSIVEELIQEIEKHGLTRETLKYQKDILPLILAISTDLLSLSATQIDEGLNRALKKIAQFSRAVRSSLFITSKDQITITNTHEWCSDPDDSQIDLLQEVPFKTFGYYQERLLRFENVIIRNLNDLPPEASGEREWIKNHGFRSLLFVPLTLEEKLYGTLGFYGKIGEEITWPQQFITLLQLISDMFVGALERNKAEEALKRSEEKFRTVAEQSPNVIFINKKGRVVYQNIRSEEMMGYEREELCSPGFDFFSLFAPESLELAKSSYEKHSQGIDIEPLEYTLLYKDGKRIDTVISTKLIDYEGDQAILGIITDITKRKAVENALLENERKMRSIFRVAPIGIGVVSNRVLQEVNKQFCEITGYSRDEIIGQSGRIVYPTDEECERVGKEKYREVEERGTGSVETRFKRKDGQIIDVLLSSTPLDATDLSTGVMYTALDITERKNAEKSIRRQNEYFIALHEITLGLISKLDLNELMRTIVTRAADLAGTAHGFVFFYEREEDVLKMHVGLGFYEEIIGHRVKPDEGIVGEVLKSGRPIRVDNYRVWKGRLPDAKFDAIKAIVGIPLKSKSEVFGVIGLSHFEENERFSDDDISVLNQFAELASIALENARLYAKLQTELSDRKRAEEALKKGDERYRELVENLNDVIYSVSPKGRFKYVSPQVESVLGYSPEDLVGKTYGTLIHPDYLEPTIKAFENTLQGKLSPNEYRMKTKSGEYRWVRASSRPVREDDRIVGAQGVLTDITDRKRAEEEQEELRDQLLQAQKMESVGRLAGGVAHDFNNMLGVILGNTELALSDVNPEDPLHENLQEILTAGKRSADITRQLLAFARKQIISPKVLDLNDTVEGMLKMLRRLIGEDIDLVWQPYSNLWPVKMDPAQIDQILANLCVNARDAIEGVGKVTIETGNVTLSETYDTDYPGFMPGEFATLSISDDGIGMDKKTVANIFEPFYTTKEVGKGTGLGLSTVYGIVKQNNGFVTAYSEPGEGSIFKIYIPRQKEEVEEATEKIKDQASQSHGETILIVEDEASVLRLGELILEKMGYKVLAAGSPGEAMEMVREYPDEIHLMMTDVVMPEMSGKALAKEITKIRPKVKIIFMSGYTANAVVQRGVLDRGTHFIQKPFSFDELARRVREVLD